MTNKFSLILAGATRAFAQYGFARTQMAEVAIESGVALGTLYRHAPSKEALFHMALLSGAGVGEQEIAAVQSNEALLETVTRFIVSLRLPSHLDETASRAWQSHDPVSAFFGKLYDQIDTIHPALRILDRSSRDWPDLAVLFSEHARATALNGIERFLQEATERGVARGFVDGPITARLILEMITWFAMHRRYTPDAPEVSDEKARLAVLSFIEAALAPLDQAASLKTERAQFA